MDVEGGELKFWVNDEEVTFNVCKSIKQQTEIHIGSSIDAINELVYVKCLVWENLVYVKCFVWENL